MPPVKSGVIEQAKLTYFSLGKFLKRIKRKKKLRTKGKTN